MFVLHAGVVAFNLGYEFDFTYLILVAAVGLLYYSGVLITHAKRKLVRRHSNPMDAE